MKICIISNLYNPYIIGGAEINAERLAKALSKENEVFVITTRPFNSFSSLVPEEEIRDRVRIRRFFPLNLYHAYFIKKRKIPPLIKIFWHILDLWNIHSFLVALRILKKEKPDIIHTNNLDGLSFSVFWAARLLRIPLIHTLNDYHLVCPHANLVCPYTKFDICKQRSFPCRVYSLFKKIIVDNFPGVVIGPSKFIVDIHKKFEFFKKVTTAVVPYSIENEQENTIGSNTSKQALDILYVGRLSKEKGVDVLVEAFKGLKENFLRLHIVGDGPERGPLINLSKTDERIEFYGKVLPQETKKFYEMTDLVVLPSIWYENFPTVVLEAFSFGVPVVGSKIGGIPEQIKDGYNGFLFTSRNKEKLKQKIQIFIEDFKRDRYSLKIFSENAYESSKKYSEENIIPHIFGIYQKLLKEKDNRQGCY